MWGVINESLKVSNKKRAAPDFVEITDPNTKLVTKIDSKQVIAEQMNKHFSSVGAKLASKLEKTSTSYRSFMKNPNPHSIFFESIEYIEIFNLINDLIVRKSVGTDGISPLILKWAASVLTPYLTVIFNQCLVEGVYPNILKQARVTPVLKKGEDKNNISSYRPISILTQLNRIFEKLLYDRLFGFFVKHNILSKKQFGFQPKHNTQHAILDLKEHILKNVEKKLVSCILFLDLKKAFDSVHHNTLLGKLEHYGIRGVALKLLTSYLTNRNQMTLVDGCLSALCLIEWGVPQGSVLGPLLFLIFINDLPLASNLHTWLFADDSVFVQSAKSARDLDYLMNVEVAKIQSWLLANKLSAHYVDKSKFMLIDLTTPKSYPHKEFQLYMGGLRISRTKTYKYLGVHIDDKMTWKHHIEKLCKKLSSVAGIIYRIRNRLSRKCLMLIYHGLVSSRLRYGILCWGTATKTLLNKLNVIHNRVVRNITYNNRRASAGPIYKSLDILPLNGLLLCEQAKFIYQYTNNMLPSVFNNYLNRPDHNHNTRYTTNLNFSRVRARTIRGQTSIECLGPRVWSIIPNEIKLANTLGIFKKKLKAYTQQNDHLYNTCQDRAFCSLRNTTPH